MTFSSTGSCSTTELRSQEPTAGIEPATCSLQVSCSTKLSYVGLLLQKRTWGSNPAFELGRLACRRQHLCALWEHVAPCCCYLFFFFALFTVPLLRPRLPPIGRRRFPFLTGRSRWTPHSRQVSRPPKSALQRIQIMHNHFPVT